MQPKVNNLYLYLSLALAGVLGLVILCTGKGELHLFLAGHHVPIADVFFRAYTHIGEWGIYAVAATLLLLKHYSPAISMLLSEALSAIVVQTTKHLVAAPRPLTWFAEHMPEVSLPLVDGQRMAYMLSFPSGHTASCFILFYCLSMLTDNRAIQILCFLMATLGAYSRIYLSMHFAEDVLGGMLIALAITAMITHFWPILQSQYSKTSKK